MEEAAKSNLTVVLLQETKLGEQAVPTAAGVAKRAGWQLEVAYSGFCAGVGGGAAILARAPAALVGVATHRSEEGRIVIADLEGVGAPVTVISFYQRRPSPCFVAALMAMLDSRKHRRWIIGGDTNEDVEYGDLPCALRAFGAECVVSGRHKTSRHDIDDVWVPPCMYPGTAAHSEGYKYSDHEFLVAALPGIQPTHRREYRIAAAHRLKMPEWRGPPPSRGRLSHLGAHGQH
jgi:hypothetical protein